jgi:hypothetical protein
VLANFDGKIKNDTKVSGQFQVDFYNVFNRANFINPNVALPGLLGTSTADNQLQPGVPFSRARAGTFGIISAADIGRVIQFSLTLGFNEGLPGEEVRIGCLSDSP